MIITIDGPAGSGKSTVARALAKDLGIAYLDTGAMYRAVTLAALRQGMDLANQEALAALAAGLELTMEDRQGRLTVRLGGEDVSAAIRAAEVTENAHFAADAPPVRTVLVAMQRRIGLDLDRTSGGVVTEGRDQGSVVFPEAAQKFYLDADGPTRARRRYDEMVASGQKVDLPELERNLAQRDTRDQVRTVGPLVKPDGAVAIDTTALTIEQVVAQVRSHVRGRQ